MWLADKSKTNLWAWHELERISLLHFLANQRSSGDPFDQFGSFILTSMSPHVYTSMTYVTPCFPKAQTCHQKYDSIYKIPFPSLLITWVELAHVIMSSVFTILIPILIHVIGHQLSPILCNHWLVSTSQARFFLYMDLSQIRNHLDWYHPVNESRRLKLIHFAKNRNICQF